MFSKLRRSKSEKVPQQQKLTGMPALKQLRSSKRNESLSPRPKSASPGMTEFERVGITSTQREMTYIGPPEGERGDDVAMNVSRNYKRPLSANVGEIREQHKNVVSQVGNVNNIDRLRDMPFSQREGLMYYDDILNGIPEEENRDVGQEDNTTPVSTPWGKGDRDSGYKSKEGPPKAENKPKKSRRKNNGEKEKSPGLHTIKQQRKASREESVSHSMRALTPRERESIQCLEEVLKNHPDGEESREEVFDSDSSSNGFENQETSRENHYLDPAVDYGFAPDTDNARRYSLESTSSVGSIIDLVSGGSNPNSPVYAAVDVTEGRNDFIDGKNDVTSNNNEFIYSTVNGFDQPSNAESPRDDIILGPDDAITHLDEVIHSFSVEDTHIEENGEDDKAGKVGTTNYEKTMDSVEEKKSTKEKRHRRKKSDSKTRDESKDRERKRKKEKKKRGDKNERSHSREGKSREERSSKRRERSHSRKSSASPASESEPIYAQVRKPKKNKNTQKVDINAANEKKKEEYPDPPSPFQNHHSGTENYLAVKDQKDTKNDATNKDDLPTGESSRRFWAELEKKQSQSPERDSTSKATHVTQSDARRYSNSHADTSSDTRFTSTPKSTRPTSDASDYMSRFVPHVSKHPPNLFNPLNVSDSMLEDSVTGLRHVEMKQSKGKVLVVNPDRNQIEEIPFNSLNIAPQNEKPQAPVPAPKPEVKITKTGAFHVRNIKQDIKTPKSAGWPHIVNQSPTAETPKPSVHSQSQYQPYRVETPKSAGFTHTVSQSLKVETPKSTGTAHDVNRNPVQLRNKVRTGRPMSLNLDESGNLAALSTEKSHSTVIKPYSSFRQGRDGAQKDNKQINKPRPFVITSLKKPIKLY